MVTPHLDESGSYVCISHMCILPCNIGEYHLISSWPVDIAKVLGKIQELKNDAAVYNFIGNKY